MCTGIGFANLIGDGDRDCELDSEIIAAYAELFFLSNHPL